MIRATTFDSSSYLEANIESSKRTRIVLLALVMASVLALSGFLNSFKHGWASQRLQRIIDPNSNYSQKYLYTDSAGQKSKHGDAKATAPSINADSSNIREVSQKYSLQKNTREDQYRSLYDAFIHSFIENTFTIRVPFFGINFDVNDLGLLGGLALSVILFLLRYSLARELDNLTFSFRLSENENALQPFYHLLAMRQVLTIPPRTGNEDVKRLNFIPKILLFFPLFVQTAVTLYDAYTMPVGFQISRAHSIFNFIFNLLFGMLLLWLTLECLNVWKKIDQVWADTFHKITRS